MPEHDDEDQTHVTCPKCGESIAKDCTLCHGRGSVLAAVAAAYRFERAGRIAAGSGEHRILIPLPEPPKEKP